MKPNALKPKLLKLLSAPNYRPLDKVDLSKKLKLPAEQHSELRDLLTEMERGGDIARIRKNRYILPETADLCTGIIRFRQSGSAFLIPENREQSELNITAENTGTALHGDRVVVRAMHEGIRQRSHESANRDAKREGRVIRILENANTTVVGTLQQTKKFFYVIPDDSRIIHDIYVHAGKAKLPRPPQIGDKVVVELDEWKSRHINPEGEIIEVLGAANAPGVDMLSIIRKHHLPVEFPQKVLDAAESVPEKIHENELANREDLRALDIITIDPDDARDFDDAIHVEPLANGEWRLGVHIADVSHYVKNHNALDAEAHERGNSVYLADRVIPMLPERLSNGICSLHPKVDRLTFSAFIDFNKSGKVKSSRFVRTVIKSAARLTYRQAFALLNGEKPSALNTRLDHKTLTDRVKTAWKLASLLRKNRFADGSLDLDFPEVKVVLDKQGRPIRLEKIENDISHQLIEEFMLAANEAVALALKNSQRPAIYRVHEDPDADRLNEYRQLALSYCYKIGDLTQRREVQKLLAAIRGKSDEYALKVGFLKSLKRATYSTQPIGHYGLAKGNYTHFTSPIRRYADLVVHRALAALAGGNPKKQTEKNARSPLAKKEKTTFAIGDLSVIAEHISTTERTAADAEKESVKLKKLEFFQNLLSEKEQQSFPAVVVDVRNYGLLVELPDFLLTGLLHVSTLDDDFYVFDPVRLRFSGRKSKQVYQIGAKISVTVDRVDIYKKQIDFRPANSKPREPRERRRSR